MEVTFAEFKASLMEHVNSVKAGEDVIVTHKGAPVARLTSVEGTDLISSLIEDGLITPPAEDRAVPRLPQAEAAKDALSSLLGRLRR
jgi:prevent-host-death family protein